MYLDATPRNVAVYFDDMRPRGITSRARATLANVQDVLFVVDTVNTPLGANGTLWMDDVKYAR